MQALVFNGSNLRVDERAGPELGSGRALIRVALAGICNTDLELVKGYMQFRGILGHEFVGVVEDGPLEWLGKRVVGEINFSCGRCDECNRSMSRHCRNRQVMGILNADGAFADYVTVPTANLHAVPDTVADVEAVFSEPLAAAFEILEQVQVASGMQAVVIGDGKLGLLVAQALQHAGAAVTAVGKHDEKLAILARLGIQTCLLCDWRAGAADLVVEASGSDAGFAAAVASVRPRGTLVLKSTLAESQTINLAPLVINEITLVGSRCGRFGPALRALESRRIEVRSLVSAEYPLSRGVEAFEKAAQAGVLKVLLRPDRL